MSCCMLRARWPRRSSTCGGGRSRRRAVTSLRGSSPRSTSRVCAWRSRWPEMVVSTSSTSEELRLPFSHLSHLECSRTGKRYDADEVQGVSEEGAPLLARYDLEQVRSTRRARRPEGAAARPVALPRGAAGARRAAHHHAGRGDDAAAPVADVRRGGRRTRPADEGRGAHPHRHLQGSRCSRRGEPGSRARREGDRDADERQRRRRVVGVRRPRRDGQPDRDAGRRAGDHPA